MWSLRRAQHSSVDSCQQWMCEEKSTSLGATSSWWGQLDGLGGNALSSDTAQCSPPTAWTDEENIGGGKVGVTK